MGDEYMHRSVEFSPYSSDPECDWEGTCPMEMGGTSVTYVPGENYIEGEPDNYAIASNPEEDSYYQYSTFNADSMRVYLTSSPIE